MIYPSYTVYIYMHTYISTCDIYVYDHPLGARSLAAAGAPYKYTYITYAYIIYTYICIYIYGVGRIYCM